MILKKFFLGALWGGHWGAGASKAFKGHKFGRGGERGHRTCISMAALVRSWSSLVLSSLDWGGMEVSMLARIARWQNRRKLLERRSTQRSALGYRAGIYASRVDIIGPFVTLSYLVIIPPPIRHDNSTSICSSMQGPRARIERQTSIQEAPQIA